jgi:3-deoxy-manno-octulosonate cytidylyltransferase (CMP-KDO synthetase)
MVEHVYRRTIACTLLDDVIIATCDSEIAAAARAFGARAVMTSNAHERATDRVAEACSGLEADIIVMVQGDEPMIQPSMIASALEPLRQDAAVKCVNLATPIRSENAVRDPNTIKIVMRHDRRALYFSRQPIPTPDRTTFAVGAWFKQVCVIPFRHDALHCFARLPQGPLEMAESIDMLRFLENGVPVHVVTTDIETHAVDTPGDLELVASLMTNECSGLALGSEH